MIGYATLGTDDLARARAFYDALLGELGARRVMEFSDELGGFTLWSASMDMPGIAVTRPYNKEPASVGNGSMLAITVKERAQVDRLHALALSLGGSCEGPPGVRGEEGPQAFYAGYFRDPDGNKLCAFRIGPA